MIGIIDFGSKKTSFIASCMKQLGYESRILNWKKYNENELKIVDKIILSGAPILLTEINFQKFIDQFGFLKNTDIPTLGICFGHQLLGLIHGSDVFKGDEVRETIEIEILKKDSLFSNNMGKIRMMEDHTEGITLPQEFVCLAKSDKYEVEAMKHKMKPIYGVQFHPEVSGIQGENLIRNFIGKN